MRHFWILFVAVALAAACGATSNDEETEQSAGQPDPAQEAGQEARRLEGSLAPTVEAGGWVLKTEDGDFLLLDLQDYPSQPWFKQGALVKVTGRADAEAVTIYMQGTPFRVQSMEPVEASLDPRR